MRTLPGTLALLLAISAAAAAAALLLATSHPDETTPPPREAAKRDAVAEPAGTARLEGASDATRPSLEAATFDALLRRTWNDGDGPGPAVRKELLRRAAAGEDVLSELLARLELDDAEFERRGYHRWEIAMSLAALGRPAAVPLAERALRTGTGAVFFEALQAMGSEAAPAVGLLVGHLPACEEHGVAQGRIFDTLRAVGPEAEAAVPLLVQVLRPPVNDALARRSGRALLAIRGPTAETLAAFRVALLDEETLARPGLLRALGEAGPGAAPLAGLLADLLDDPERSTAVSAAAALGEIGAADLEITRALVDMLLRGPPGEKAVAAGALARLGEAGTETLLQVAKTAEDADARLRAVGALYESDVPTEERLKPLLAILDEELERDWKRRALGHVAALRPPPDAAAVLPAVVRYLDDPRLRTATLQVLAALDQDDARAVLRDFARAAPTHDTRLEVASTLRGSGGTGLRLEALLQVLTSPAATAEEQWKALDLLANSRPPALASRVLPTLRPYLEHADDGIRRRAYVAASVLEGSEAEVVRILIDGLRRRGYFVECGPGLVRRSAFASKSVPAIVDQAIESRGRWNMYEIHAMKVLGGAWSGTVRYIDERLEHADEANRAMLESLRRAAGGK